jgi:hypothetical protein
MQYTTQPAVRHTFITGLRDLAAYLDSHPAVPVPLMGTNISLYAPATDDGGRGQVARIAAQLGAAIADDTRHGGHLTTTRLFGPISYGIVFTPATVMAAHYACGSYYYSVTPDVP